jgi:hypothetical protein
MPVPAAVRSGVRAESSSHWYVGLWPKCDVPTGSKKCRLFGVDRTYRRHVLNDANDPEPTVSYEDSEEKVRQFETMAKGTYTLCPEYALGEHYTPERVADFAKFAEARYPR